MTAMAWPLDCGTGTFDALDPSTWDEEALPAGYSWQERETSGELHLISPDGTDLSAGFALVRALYPALTERVVCEYCDQTATRITRDSREPLCEPCTRDQYGRQWRAESSAFTARARERYQREL